MKLFINGISAMQGGGVTYLNQFLEHLSEFKDIQVHVYGFSKACPHLINRPGLIFINLPGVHKNLFYRWFFEKFSIPRILKMHHYDIAFFPGGILTSRCPPGTPGVTMFRNMLPFSDRDLQKFPMGFKRIRYWLLKRLFLRSYIQANHTIFVSRFAQSVIADHYPGITKHSSVIPHGVNDLAVDYDIKQPLEDELKFRTKYILYVSILNVYKHQIEIIRGLGLFRIRHGWTPKLVLVGPDTGGYRERLESVIVAEGLKEDIVLTGEVPHEETATFYKDAGLFLFGSTCENCPNILLEAMSSGVPILCSSHQPMPEFLGDHGWYFDPEIPESFAKGLEDVLKTEPSIVIQRRMAAQSAAGTMTWRHTVSKTVRCFEKLLKQVR